MLYAIKYLTGWQGHEMVHAVTEAALMMEPTSADAARENLIYIRKTLEAAGQFTAVPGKCLMAAGVTALAGVAANQFITGAPWHPAGNQERALAVWGAVLVVSLAVVSFGIYRKSQQLKTRIQAPLLRKLLWGLSPALFVGGLLTHFALQSHNLECLPTIWLGCYGTAVVNGGLVSVAPVRFLGLSLLLAAAGSAFFSAGMGLTWMSVGFGWLHLVFGAYIAWRHNG
jgi:hypothetical protein